jgi:hypothetical protein
MKIINLVDVIVKYRHHKNLKLRKGSRIMPYTKKEDRTMGEILPKLVNLIKAKGDLNYTICELVGQLCLRDGGLGYTTTSNWIDGVHGAERELTRRLLGPYEDLKANQNGDVESFVELLKTMK